MHLDVLYVIIHVAYHRWEQLYNSLVQIHNGVNLALLITRMLMLACLTGG